MKITEPDSTLIGLAIRKISRKPFKSGSKLATVAGFTIHPVTNRLCFTFVEDDTYVECIKCNLA